MQIEITGSGAITATEELLSISGLEGSYERITEVEREGTLATIATIVGILGGTITISEKLYQSPVNLQVEESGCLTELGSLIAAYKAVDKDKQNYFDLVHLTGHAGHHNNKPCFFTEDEYGDVLYSDAEDIVTGLRYPLPPLIFLSGCGTGYSKDGVIPSLAEQLLDKGAGAVIAWGDKVTDTNATEAAKVFYSRLAEGGTVTEALGYTYQTLIKQVNKGNIKGDGCVKEEWHKLRLYVKDSLPGALVTPLRHPERKKLRKPADTTRLLDSKEQYSVVTGAGFVGRRRQLQNCLRTIKTDRNKVGVLIHGMGGWGKSSIAIRLSDRLPHYQPVLWRKQIDQASLIQKLRDKTRGVISDLDDNNIELKYRLADFFEQVKDSFLLILDDFEWNLEPRQGRYILKPDVARVLDALVWAIQDTGTDHKVIITCRYDFDSELLDYFFKQGLEPFRKAELDKKLDRLEYFNKDKIPENLRERALNLADGNPRLLEYLNNEVLSRNDAESKLTELEQHPEQWKNRIIWDELYQLIDQDLETILSYCLVYELPVPMTALEYVCKSLPNYQQQLQRGLELGLIEISPESREKDRVYRVSRILPQIITEIKLPENEQKRYDLYRIASDILHQLWAKEENKNEEQWGELFRVALSVKDNQQRFRQEFQVMLDVQYNSESDRAYELELRKLKDELSPDNLCQQLEEYLKQGEWRKADEETAWIWYQLMVLRNEDDFYDLARNFPEEMLKEMDDLWIKYSQGKFGFSVQKKIYLDLGGTKEYNSKVWDNFGECVGWKAREGDWLYYSDLTFDYQNTNYGNIPFLPYARFPDGGYAGTGGGRIFSLLFSLSLK